MRRFFIPPEQISRTEAIVSGSDAHHMKDVLRLRPGAEVVIFDGTGNDYHACIVSMGRSQVGLSIIAPISNASEPTLSLTLAQGLLKDKKMDMLVRQLTELGLTRWMPFIAQRSVPAPHAKRMASRVRRWEKISREAVKQCGRSRMVIIDPVVSFAEVLAASQAYDVRIVFWENFASASSVGQLRHQQPASVFLLIGPEGGFSDTEIKQAKAAGFQAMGMGPRILRAETAALAAGVLAQLIFGDMNENYLDNPGSV